MFPATQTQPAPDAAPSLADIVHEQTQGGRLIVNFLAQAMLGDLTDFKPRHRLQASERLIKLKASPDFTTMVREHTRGGDLISQFLIQAIMGQLPDFKPCHRMEAQRQLALINPKMARAFAEDNTARRSRPLSPGAVAPSPSPLTGEGWGEGEGDPAQQLADIIRQETDDGRDIARFFIDVMQGTRTGFDQRFRFSAAEVLIHRGYDDVAARCPDPAAHEPPTTPAPYGDTGAHTGAVDAHPVPASTWKPEWTHFEYPEDNTYTYTYDFSIYGDDEYERDIYGDKALVHIFGDDETKSVSNQAVLDYQVDRIEAHRAAGNSDLDILQPAPDPPDDGDFGQDTYGYNALLYIYGSKDAAREGYISRNGPQGEAEARPPRRRSRSPNRRSGVGRNPSPSRCSPSPTYRRRGRLDNRAHPFV